MHKKVGLSWPGKSGRIWPVEAEGRESQDGLAGRTREPSLLEAQCVDGTWFSLERKTDK